MRFGRIIILCASSLLFFARANLAQESGANPPPVEPTRSTPSHDVGAPQRIVIAHYQLPLQDYQEDNSFTDPTQELKVLSYMREIREAEAAGIDVFALNVCGWFNGTELRNGSQVPTDIRRSAQMFEAAIRVNNGFKIAFSADLAGCNPIMAPEAVEDMMRRFANDPRYSQVYFHYNGKPVLTTFAGNIGTWTPAAWQQIKSELATGTNPSTKSIPGILSVGGPPNNAPMSVYFVPAFFWGGGASCTIGHSIEFHPMEGCHRRLLLLGACRRPRQRRNAGPDPE
jgi:hypothetical protein